MRSRRPLALLLLLAVGFGCGQASPTGPAPRTADPADGGFLWSSGYELDPWDAEWGLAWKQDARHEIVTGGTPFGDRAAQVTYPKGDGPGTYSSAGGAQYRMDFALLHDPIPYSEEMYVRYYVKFGDDFDFVRGGKLPGLFGGRGNTGGDRPDGFDGWSARIMWLANGRVIQYVYNPDQPDDYGEVMDWNEGGGSRYFVPGKWHCVETYIKMNSVNGEGEAGAEFDGIVRSWLDGELALDRTDVRFRFTDSIRVDGFHFSTFFGGGDESWAATKDETVMFDNFVLHDARIGCVDASMLPPHPAPGPEPVTATSTTLVYNGDDPAWATDAWERANSTKAFDDTGANHTPGGTTSAYVHFAPDAWDATSYAAPAPFDPNAYTHVRLRLMPEGPDVSFRVQFRGSADSADVLVDGSYAYHRRPWQVGVWEEVIIPIGDFASVDGQETLLIRSASNTPSDPFRVDDLELVVAE